MDDPTKTSRIRFGISKKLLLSVVLLTLLICFISTFSGYVQYSNTIRKLYNDNGYVIANIILEHVDHDQIAHYARTWEEDENYADMAEYLRSVEKASGAAYIYIVTISEDHTMRYIYDSSGLSIGDTDPLSAYFDEAWAAYTQGIKPDNYMVRHSARYGYLTSSMLPVIDSEGKIAAVLLVDVWMELIEATLRGYIINMVLISLVTLAVFSIAHWFLMRKNFIGPLMRIRSNVTEFAQDNTLKSMSLEKIQTKDEIQDLAGSISRMEQDIIRYIGNIRTITAEKERIGAELNIATQIQADMLPRIFPAFPERKEFDIYATMTPAKEVGGDFYDFFLIDDDHLGLVMADVSGKGVPAALFMVIAKTLIKNRAQMGGGPAEILSYVNEQLCEGNDAELFVTVWFAILEISTGKGLAANAGHEHPVIRRANGEYELVVYRHSPAVATMEGMRFKEHAFELYPGDSLFVYTDGVPEATNAAEELFGTDRMLAALNREADAKPKELLRNVRADIDAFVADAPQFDDITMLGLCYEGPEKTEREITVPAAEDQLETVTAMVDGELEKLGCSAKDQMLIDVAVEEIFVNIAHYAYAPDTGDAAVRVRTDETSKTIEIEFRDSGVPFDPLAKEDPDVTLSAEERDVGGLGIYLVKKNMDSVTYDRIDGQNVLTIQKKLG